MHTTVGRVIMLLTRFCCTSLSWKFEQLPSRQSVLIVLSCGEESNSLHVAVTLSSRGVVTYSGSKILTCLTWVSLPFWWLERMQIWKRKAFTGLSMNLKHCIRRVVFSTNTFSLALFICDVHVHPFFWFFRIQSCNMLFKKIYNFDLLWM